MIKINIANYFEIAAAITATLCWRSLRKTDFKWFIPYLWMIVLVEISAKISWQVYKQPNAWLYNFSLPVEYSFYCFVLKSAFVNPLYKKIATACMILIVGYAMYTVVFISHLRYIEMTIFTLGSFLALVLSILYFIELYNSDSPESLFKNPYFWMVTGIFLFATGELCYHLLSSFIPLQLKAFDARLKLFRSINTKLILVLYSCFIIGFICQTISGTYRYRKA